MESLSQESCIPCRGNLPRVSDEEIEQLKPLIPHWSIVEESGEARLQRIYHFPDFKTALYFTQLVGLEAEKEGHHPALLTEWGKVTVTWWTHAIKGLHRNDFIMASKTEQIATEDTLKLTTDSPK
jgi:4a-hydroxytetrahydrobiopterin dehydratase